MLVGGGSGGHIVPALAVADELHNQRKDVELFYVVERGSRFADLPKGHAHINRVFMVRAGKFRRYHGSGWRQLLDVPTMLKNIRDVLYVIVGFAQAMLILKKTKPDVIFVKGGFVGVPIGLAAAVQGIPFMTHDSDAVPGLANRIISRWAAKHAVALPENTYSYPEHKTQTVGVPISERFEPATPAQIVSYKKELSLPPKSSVVLVTGGGLGAQRLNDAVVASTKDLLADKRVRIVHVAGQAHEQSVFRAYQRVLEQAELDRVHVLGFTKHMYKLSAVADVVVTRAGATSLAEFARQGKACVVVPNPQLTGGHQTKNALALAQDGAIVCIAEDEIVKDDSMLASAIAELLANDGLRHKLEKRIQSFVVADSAKQLATMLIHIAQEQHA